MSGKWAEYMKSEGWKEYLRPEDVPIVEAKIEEAVAAEQSALIAHIDRIEPGASDGYRLACQDIRAAISARGEQP